MSVNVIYSVLRDHTYICLQTTSIQKHIIKYNTCFDKVPISVVKSELEALSVKKWQREWDQSTKGQITKQYSPDITARLNMKLNLTHNFTLMVTGHGNINSYLHRFRIKETPKCTCGTQDQTIDHLLSECELLRKERNVLTTNVLKKKRVTNKQV